jgi:hypothetical protein
MKQWYYSGLGVLELSLVTIYLILGGIQCNCVISLLLLAVVIEPGFYFLYSLWISHQHAKLGGNLCKTLLMFPVLYMLLLFGMVLKLDLANHNILKQFSFQPHKHWWAYSIIIHVLCSTCLSISGVALSSVEQHITYLSIGVLCITSWSFLSYGYAIYTAMIEHVSNIVSSKFELMP